MSSWKSGYMDANGLRLHYTRTGGDRPPVVLAHGVTDDGLCWTPVAEALAPEYDVIMVDARGHGRSDAPEVGYDPATQAADLHGVIVGLGLQKAAILGHSMGAVTTLVLAGTYPEVPGAMLLEDPPGWWAAPPERARAGESREAGGRSTAAIYGREPEREERTVGMHAWIAGLKHKTREELIAEQRAANPAWSEGELGPWADSKLRVSEHVARLFNTNPAAAMDWPATLRRVDCPALLITADPERGAILKPDAVTALQDLVPHVEVAHIPGAGHNIRREQFARFMEVVRGFLAGIDR